MSKKLRNTIIISVSSLIVLTAGFLLFYPVPDPPVLKLKTARDSLSVAVKNQADRYSPDLYIRAKAGYDSAMAVWGRENERFIYFRNYDVVEDYARLSAKMADSATDSTLRIIEHLKENLSPRIDTLNILMKRINEKYSNYPYPPEVHERISRGKMLLKDAETAFQNNLFLEAESFLTESENLLLSSWEFADLNLRQYFTSYPTWKKWIDRTIAASKTNGGYSIIIDKFSRKLVVYNKGKKINEFSAELGRNWVGNKRVKGDKATPEGMYKITRKLDGGKTKYHKALLLNYPNDEDAARFRRDVSNGALPTSADIGGMIEIHGNGGKGVDWTEGCIALKDNEIDIVYRYVKIGTPVTIVGSMQDIDKALEK
jgi:hypothetical protein